MCRRLRSFASQMEKKLCIVSAEEAALGTKLNSKLESCCAIPAKSGRYVTALTAHSTRRRESIKSASAMAMANPAGAADCRSRAETKRRTRAKHETPPLHKCESARVRRSRAELELPCGHMQPAPLRLRGLHSHYDTQRSGVKCKAQLVCTVHCSPDGLPLYRRGMLGARGEQTQSRLSSQPRWVE